MKNRIQNIIENDMTLTYRYGVMHSFNFEADENFFPAVFMLPIIQEGELSESGNHFINTYTAVLLFCTPGGLAEDMQTTHPDNVTAMRQLSLDFILRLHNSVKASKRKPNQVNAYMIGSMDPTDRKDFDQFFNAFDSQVDGVGLTVSVTLQETPAECLVS